MLVLCYGLGYEVSDQNLSNKVHQVTVVAVATVVAVMEMSALKSYLVTASFGHIPHPFDAAVIVLLKHLEVAH